MTEIVLTPGISQKQHLFHPDALYKGWNQYLLNFRTAEGRYFGISNGEGGDGERFCVVEGLPVLRRQLWPASCPRCRVFRLSVRRPPNWS